MSEFMEVGDKKGRYVKIWVQRKDYLISSKVPYQPYQLTWNFNVLFLYYLLLFL